MNHHNAASRPARRGVHAALLVALMAGAMAGPVGASPAPSVRVSHADLDLDTAPGMRSFERRLQAAAERVCGDADPRALRHTRHVNDCRDRAVNEAMADVATPTMFVALR